MPKNSKKIQKKAARPSLSSETTDSNTDTETERAERGVRAGAISDEHPKRHGEVILVETTDGYKGDSFEEKIESFLGAHHIVMINRTWCIFSINPIDFLVRMGATVHSLEVDTVPEGNIMLNYLKKKLSYHTQVMLMLSGAYKYGESRTSFSYLDVHM